MFEFPDFSGFWEFPTEHTNTQEEQSHSNQLYALLVRWILRQQLHFLSSLGCLPLPHLLAHILQNRINQRPDFENPPIWLAQSGTCGNNVTSLTGSLIKQMGSNFKL